MLISIVIATFNADKSIQRCLDSILYQDVDGVEVIVVDGASTDDTMNIIKSHSIVTKYVSEVDDGIYDAWNKGVSISKGEWIVFIGADDYFVDGALFTLCQKCVSCQDLDYICGKVALIDSHQNVLRVIGTAWRWSAFRNFMNVAHPGSAHNRRLFSEVGGFDSQRFNIVGDYELLLRKGVGLKTGFVDQVLVFMTIGGVSYMSVDALIERFKAKQKNCSVSAISNIISLVFAFLKLFVKSALFRIGIVRV